MMLVTGRFAIDPQRRDEFLEFARKLIDNERNAEGCLAFAIYEDITSENTFLMFEQWVDEAASDAHAESTASGYNDAMLDSFIIGEPSFDTYEF